MIQQLEGFIEEILAEYPEIFLVQVRIKPTNNIKVFIDTDEGITIEKCIRINRKLYKKIEEAVLYEDGDFSLEVSSPGLGEPILLNRQYRKNIGRYVSVLKTDDSIVEGLLKDCYEQGIMVETSEGKGKKLIVKLLTVPFTDIKKAAIEVKF